MSSLSGKIGTPGGSSYSATKFAMVSRLILLFYFHLYSLITVHYDFMIINCPITTSMATLMLCGPSSALLL